MITDITFKEGSNNYISDPIQLTGDVGLHLEFPADEHTPPALKNSFVQVNQSMTGDKFVEVHNEWLRGEKVYDTAIRGVVPDMFVQIICNPKPSVAKILSE